MRIHYIDDNNEFVHISLLTIGIYLRINYDVLFFFSSHPQ